MSKSEPSPILASSPSPIRGVLVDDHPMVRMSLRLLLRSTEDIEVVGEAGDGEDAVRICAQVHPDIVLMDLRLPRLDGVATTQALQHQTPVPHMLVLTAHYDERLIPEALAAGASGYVLKDGDVDEFITAIRSAHARQ